MSKKFVKKISSRRSIGLTPTSTPLPSIKLAAIVSAVYNIKSDSLLLQTTTGRILAMSSLDLKLLQDVSDKYITGFTPTIAAVEIDGQRITDFELMEDGATIKFRMPPHTDGHVGVKLILRNGTSQVVASGFTYIAMPLAIINEIANPSTGDSILRVFALFSFAIFAFIVMVKLMRLMSIR